MHAELLYIHPFREGNGRTARLLVYLIYLLNTGEELDIDMLISARKKEYIDAVQQAALSEYSKMEALFEKMAKL